MFNTKRLIAASLLLSAASMASAQQTGVVYWGNTETGKAVRVVNKVDGEKIAKAQVDSIGGSGWELLEKSNLPGHGAAICVKKGNRIYFHTAHGFATGKEAVTAASDKAKATGGTTYLCDQPRWMVNGALKEEKPSSWIGTAKEVVRDIVEPPKCKPTDGSAEARLAKPRKGETVKNPPSKGEAKACEPDSPKPQMQSCYCVRG